MGVCVLVGSKKGAFFLESDAERRDWRVRGPFCEHWPLTHVAADPLTGDDLRRRRQRLVRAGGVEIARFRRDLDPFQPGPRLPPGRDAGAMRLGRPRRARPALCRRRAGGPVRQRRRGPKLPRVRGPAPPSHAAGMAAGRRRARSCTRSSPIPPTRAGCGSASPRRRVLHRGRRRDLEPAQLRHALRFPARGPALPRVRPVRA